MQLELEDGSKMTNSADKMSSSGYLLSILIGLGIKAAASLPRKGEKRGRHISSAPTALVRVRKAYICANGGDEVRMETGMVCLLSVLGEWMIQENWLVGLGSDGSEAMQGYGRDLGLEGIGRLGGFGARN